MRNKRTKCFVPSFGLRTRQKPSDKSCSCCALGSTCPRPSSRYLSAMRDGRSCTCSLTCRWPCAGEVLRKAASQVVGKRRKQCSEKLPQSSSRPPLRLLRSGGAMDQGFGEVEQVNCLQGGRRRDSDDGRPVLNNVYFGIVTFGAIDSWSCEGWRPSWRIV
jgi:hypothetical protein